MSKVANAKQLTKSIRSSGDSEVKTQYAALCYRIEDGKPQVLLITSRGTGRWVLPKGWPIKGTDGAETALQEAWEEAGVVGRVGKSGLGLFFYDKIMDDGSAIPCVVEVFAVKVEKLAAKFPERDERTRRWFSLKKAAARVQEPDLARLLLQFDPGGQ